ncbi:MAG: T9SS type A sorting domain-containing protein [Bacteroidia bacterium]
MISQGINKIILVLIIVFGFYLCGAQSYFQKIYGTALNEYGFSVKQTNDGGFIVCGMQYHDTVNTDVYLLKTDPQGDTSWIKYYGGSSADIGEHAEQTSDGGFIVIGIASSFGAGSSDVYLIKTNSSGDTLWTRTYGGTASELGHYVKQTSDGGYILAGHTDSFGTQGDFYLLKINANGDTAWTRSYGGIKHDHAFSVSQTNDNGYIIAGHSLSFGTMGGFYAIKTNAFGDTIWTKGYGGNGNSFCYSVEQTLDGGYILGGETECFGAGLSDGLAIKLNSAGDTMWARTYGGAGSDFLNCIKQLPGGGYILAGYTDSYGAGGTDVLLIKTDSNGNILWSNTYGGAGDDEASAVELTNDGGYIITGSTKSFGTGGYDVYLIRTDSIGNSGCSQAIINSPAINANITVFKVASHSFAAGGNIGNTQTISGYGANSYLDACSLNSINKIYAAPPSFKIFPNPVTDFITIEGDNSLKEMTLYDALGNIVYKEEEAKKKSVINMNSLSEGIYLLRLNGESARVIKGSR